MRHIKEHRVRSGEQGRTKSAGTELGKCARFSCRGAAQEFRAAAIALSQSVNALRTQIGQLEQHLGTMLFTRHVEACRDRGRRPGLHQRTAYGTRRIRSSCVRSSSDTGIEAEVRLSVTEGLGTFWIAPHLHEFRAAKPEGADRPALSDVGGRHPAPGGRCRGAVATPDPEGCAGGEAGPHAPDAVRGALLYRTTRFTEIVCPISSTTNW